MAEKPRPGKQGGVQTAKRAPPFKLQNAEDRRVERYLKLLIYGNYGVGKTHLASTANEVESMGDVLMVNAEAGDLTLENNPEFESITTVPVRNFTVFNHLYEFLMLHCKARNENNVEKLIELESFLSGCEPEDIKEPKRFRTLIVDTLSEVETYCMNQILGITDSTKINEEVSSPEWADYGKNLNMMMRLCRSLRDLDMHVIFTCAEKYNQDETKRMKYVPSLTGKLAKQIQGFMDMVGYYVSGQEGDKVIRKLYVVPSAQGKYDAKHRYSLFKGDSFLNPTIGSILKEVGLLQPEGAAIK